MKELDKYLKSVSKQIPAGKLGKAFDILQIVSDRMPDTCKCDACQEIRKLLKTANR